jgi:TRAP transporter TAXI family solute receptor
VIPGRNDVSRLATLRAGRVHFSAGGSESVYAQEGILNFASKIWGPQPVRALLSNYSDACSFSFATAADANINTVADMAGKRMTFVQGAPSLNNATAALLSYANLTWDDVTRVDFGGFGASWTGLIEGQGDAAFASTNSGKAYEAEAGPRGLFWPPIDPDNAEGLARMSAIAPFFTTNKAVVGATIDGTDGYQGAGYAYPVLTAIEATDADLVYNMTKAMVELFPQYDGKAPGIGGWALDKQDMEWVVPYHEGAIRYFEEAGIWTETAQEHNDNLIARQEALAAAWEETKAASPDDWESAWAEARRNALEAGGFEVVL